MALDLSEPFSHGSGSSRRALGLCGSREEHLASAISKYKVHEYDVLIIGRHGAGLS